MTRGSVKLKTFAKKLVYYSINFLLKPDVSPSGPGAVFKLIILVAFESSSPVNCH